MVEIAVIDNLAKIKSDKSIFSVNCIPAIDYPNISFNDIKFFAASLLYKVVSSIAQYT